jgi:gas vesicle protein
MQTNGKYGFSSGLFLGATLGALAALLVAPTSGRAARANLYARGERLKERAAARANGLVGLGEAAIERVKDAAGETARGVKRGAQRFSRHREDGAAGEALPSSIPVR